MKIFSLPSVREKMKMKEKSLEKRISGFVRWGKKSQTQVDSFKLHFDY